MPDTKVIKRVNRRDKGVIPLPVTPGQSVIPQPAGFQGPMANTTLINYPQNATATERGNRRDRGRGGMTWQENPIVAGLMGTPLPMAMNAPMNAMAPQFRPVNFQKPETFQPTRAGRMGRPGTGVPKTQGFTAPVPDEIAAIFNQMYTSPESGAWNQNVPQGGYPGAPVPAVDFANPISNFWSQQYKRYLDYKNAQYLKLMANHLFETLPEMGGGGYTAPDWWGNGGSGGGGGGGGYGNPAFNAWMSRLLSWNVNR